MSSYRIHTALFEGLVTLRGEALKPSPGVAEAWAFTEDGLSVEFQLRADARWSDGEPVTAEDFVFSYRRILSPQFGAQNANLLYLIKGAEAYHQGLSGQLSGVRALGPQRLQIDLERQTPYFLSLLAHPSWYPVPRHVVMQHGQAHQLGSKWTRPGNHVSNGPFRLLEWRLGEVVAVEQNPFYHDHEQVGLKGIRFLPIVDQNTEERAFLAGQLHLTYTVPQSRVPHWLGTEGASRAFLQNESDLGTYYYAFNVREAPLDDLRVRRALHLALDKEQLTRDVRQRGELVAHSFTPPGVAGYSPPRAAAYAPEQARELLAQAGYPYGEGFPVLTLLYNESDTHRKLAETAQAIWKQQLGISVELQSIEWKALLQRRQRGEFQILRAGWIGDYNDPETFLSLMHSQGTNNHSGWGHDEYDRWLERAASATSPHQRFLALATAEAILLREAPLSPVFHYNRLFLKHPDVQGWTANVLGYRRWQDLWLGQGHAASP
jgi:oligopeptide transport system substrate-binding protein